MSAERSAEVPAGEASGDAPGRGRLEGRRILVVGGGQEEHGLEDAPIGNGRAMSVLFGREGASVAVADLNEASAEKTAEMVRAEGATAEVLVADAADESASAAMFEGAVKALGGLDGVVMNLGIGAGFAIRGTSAEDWDRVMGVNVRSHFLGCKNALATMKEGGAIVLLGSIAAREVMPWPAYAASKAALESLCRQAAVEGAPEVRTNLLQPGIDRHLTRAAGLSGQPAPRSGPDSGRPAGDRMGDRIRCSLPALERVELHDRTDPDRRRRPHHRPEGGLMADGPRIPPLPPQEWSGEIKTILDAVPGGVDNRLGDNNIFPTLAQHPELFRAWLRLGGYLLTSGKLPGRDRELLILRTAVNCRSSYEWGQHVRISLAGGFEREVVDRVLEGPEAEGWTAHEAALLRAADELHGSSRISDETWATLEESYDTERLIETTMVVGHYQMLAGALNSFGVELDEGLEPLP